MADLQIQGKKIALLDSNNNTIYTLPDSAGSSGSALVTDGAGKLFFGGINLDAVLAAGDSSSRNAKVNNLKVGVLEAKAILAEIYYGFQGSTSGYTSGGNTSSGVGVTTTIDKFPFSTDANATDVGDLTVQRGAIAPQCSSTFGYNSGGGERTFDPTTGAAFDAPRLNVIDKFPFSSDTNATDVGDLGVQNMYAGGHSSSTHGYISGGYAKEPTVFTSDYWQNPSLSSSPTIPYTDPSQPVELSFISDLATARLEKFPFASDANATNVGNLGTGATYMSSLAPAFHIDSSTPMLVVGARKMHLSFTAEDAGWTMGGWKGDPSPPSEPIIFGGSRTQEKFPFANETTQNEVTFIDNDGFPGLQGGSASSTTHGYRIGGYLGADFSPASAQTKITKFPFATGGDVTDVGNLDTAARENQGSQSSTTFGYNAGGSPPNSGINNIQKFPFASDTNGSDVGDLTVSRKKTAGQQV